MLPPTLSTTASPKRWPKPLSDVADTLEVRLAFVPPFDADAVLGSLRAHAIPGCEVVTHDSICRIIHTASGPRTVTVTLAPDAVTLTVESGRALPAAAAEELVATVRQWFDLDLNPDTISEALGGDPIIGPLVAARPGLRMVGSVNGFESAVMAVLGQQVSLARARALGGKAVAAYGEPGSAGLTPFPTADALAAVPVESLRATLGLTGARARAVHALAVASVEGLELTPFADPVVFRAGLLQIPGIGPWTADYLSVRVLGDRDAFTASDLVLRRALGGISAREAEALSARWRPYRAYALFHLWTATAY